MKDKPTSFNKIKRILKEMLKPFALACTFIPMCVLYCSLLYLNLRWLKDCLLPALQLVS